MSTNIVEPDDIGRCRSVGRPVTRKAGHARLDPPFVEDFELAPKVWHWEAHWVLSRQQR